MWYSFHRKTVARKTNRRGSVPCRLRLEALEDRYLLSVNIALNTSRMGFPTPLESDHGWGGGSDQWEIADGQRSYDFWAHGLAFTGGPDGWAGEPGGTRQATIDFGMSQTFNNAVIWWHGQA